jgi:lipoprotein-releasing system ATP-binding protein
MNEGSLSIHGIEKEYPNGEGGRLQVLCGIDLELARGGSVSIVGRSGAGKSTLLHILGALEQPTRGEVEIGGRSVSELDDVERSRVRNKTVGFIFQFHYLLAEFSALENVAIPLRIRGDLPEEAKKAAYAILAEVGLADRLHHRPAQLSGGEQQRVAVARALVHQPDFILADEPTGNLDKPNGRLVMDLLFRQLEKRGMGLVLVTHDDSLAALTQRKYLLEEGKLNLSQG